ncbi:MAG: glycosyltransferase family 4 protein [Crocosphaera sp.]|nr:glycosyltransferase family 4 protein [Crocosphaera sp.]
MKIENLLITGEQFFIERHKFLFKEFVPHIPNINYLSLERWYQSKYIKKIGRKMKTILPQLTKVKGSSFGKNSQSFQKKSQEIEAKIKAQSKPPDLIFHLYGMFSPVTQTVEIPYVTYLDYNMTLAHRNWSPWANFPTDEDLNKWIEYEKKSYQNSHHIFTKSAILKDSLVNDYQIDPNKITVVWSSGNFLKPYEEEKQFGSHQILFNGSDFKRKGGDLLLEAFRIVRSQISNVKLVIVGQKLFTEEPGIINIGYVSNPQQMKQLFLNSDLVVSPAYCEPLGLFLIESMNYGIPCIVSNQDGMSEIVEHQKNGLVLNERKPETLASQMIELLNNPLILEKMSQQARLKIKTQLNWSVIAQKMLNIMDNL